MQLENEHCVKGCLKHYPGVGKQKHAGSDAPVTANPDFLHQVQYTVGSVSRDSAAAGWLFKCRMGQAKLKVLFLWQRVDEQA